jgi:hypothetical protein
MVRRFSSVPHKFGGRDLRSIFLNTEVSSIVPHKFGGRDLCSIFLNTEVLEPDLFNNGQHSDCL